MAHLDDGMLRRMIDEPMAIADSSRRHYEGCPRCRVRYEHIQADARYAAAALDPGDGAPNAARAIAAVQQRLAIEQIEPGNRRRTERRLSDNRRIPSIGGLVAALALTGALLWSPATSLAQNFISLFQPSQITAIQTTTAELASLNGLRKYGTISQPNAPPMQKAADAAQASTISGMTVHAPSPGTPGLPAEAPTYAVQPSATASFTFDAAKARAAAAAAGETIPTMPANIDGSTLNVTVGTTVVSKWDSGGDFPDLLIGQMRAPSVTATGASVKELEDYVLSLPEVSPQLADEIRAINKPNSTLPIPVPVDVAKSQSVQVQGVQGIEIGDNTGLGSAVIWEKDGIIYGVGGPLTNDQVLTIANSLR